MKQTKISLVLLLLGLMSFQAFAAEFDDAAFCKQMEAFKANGEVDVGKMVDKYTRNDGIAVLCGNKIVDFKKFMFANQNDMREGWQDRKAAQWNSIYCEGEWLEAINNGWTVALTLVTQDGKRFWHKATCK